MKLFQETWRRRPFWMLVGCILVNRATWEKAEPILKTLVKTYRTPAGLRDADPAILSDMLRPLGLQGVRTSNLINLALAWSRYGRRKRRTAEDIARLPGCGRYASDSWAIFVDRVVDFSAEHREKMDKKLKLFVMEHS